MFRPNTLHSRSLSFFVSYFAALMDMHAPSVLIRNTCGIRDRHQTQLRWQNYAAPHIFRYLYFPCSFVAFVRSLVFCSPANNYTACGICETAVVKCVFRNTSMVFVRIGIRPPEANAQLTTTTTGRHRPQLGKRHIEQRLLAARSLSAGRWWAYEKKK